MRWLYVFEGLLHIWVSARHNAQNTALENWGIPRLLSAPDGMATFGHGHSPSPPDV